MTFPPTHINVLVRPGPKPMTPSFAVTMGRKVSIVFGLSDPGVRDADIYMSHSQEVQPPLPESDRPGPQKHSSKERPGRKWLSTDCARVICHRSHIDAPKHRSALNHSICSDLIALDRHTTYFQTTCIECSSCRLLLPMFLLDFFSNHVLCPATLSSHSCDLVSPCH